jgi:hypothetical protein
MADLSGGKVFYPADMMQIPNTLKENPVVTDIAYTNEKLHTITDLMWIFFIILAFAAAEWVLRKYWGGY